MGGAQDLKLLGTVSRVNPYVIHAQIVLSIKGLSYEYLREDLRSKSDLLVESNPVHKKVPVLIHDGRPICDSSIIVQYIAKALAGNGTSILPADPYDRAITHFWAAYIDDKLFPSCLGILKGKIEEERAKKLNEAFAALELSEAAFGECSKGKAFFSGNTIGYLGIALRCYLCWFDRVSYLGGVALLDATRTPKLAASAERFKATEPVKALVPGVDKVEAYLNTVLYPRWNAAAANN